ncbi:MAG: PhzF family phenazine biosynthesis protein [Defluviitaleaceae bacterium]|nr:PhzF family phenazine biosynthesis protein [Defluviitaleaceae bacterium]MCL2274195.1 PhzF family phenazine biosynthesis protein [Defluviitaleaceae bacterium]
MEYHIINAFTNAPFSGNPAGVCLPDSDLSEAQMQRIATENNLSETAFLVKKGDTRYGLRWFTPTTEVALCGHATLASAYVLFDERERNAEKLQFKTASGLLTVTRNGEWICLNLPAAPPEKCPSYPFITNTLGITPLVVYKSIDFMAVVENEATVRSIKPCFAAFETLVSEAGQEYAKHGLIVTAQGNECDFVSRYFAPNVGIPEDPVTGSAHCTLVPYWAKKLGKQTLTAQQLSARGGVLQCEDKGNRVLVSGQATRYLRGQINV